MRISMLLLATVVVLALSVNGFASEIQIEMRWSELGAFLQNGKLIGSGAKAMLVLPDGTIVEGKILGVEEEQFILSVSKSSNEQEYPKGRLSIPRSSVTTIRLTQIKGYGRLGFTIAGVSVGSLAAYCIAPPETSGRAADVAAGLTLWGGGIGGYFAGRHLDRKTTIIRILPE